LETIKKNYETQLNVMTEHLVQLNEKLSQYEAELSSLKACKVSLRLPFLILTFVRVMSARERGERGEQRFHFGLNFLRLNVENVSNGIRLGGSSLREKTEQSVLAETILRLSITLEQEG
jgi:hypothetical protein